MVTIPEHIKKYLTPAQLMEIEADGGVRFAEWLSRNPQYAQPPSSGSNKSPTKEAAKSAAKGFVKGQIKKAAKGGYNTPATMTGSGTAFSSGAIYEGIPIGSMVDGSTQMSTGQIVPASEGSVVGPAGADGTSSSPNYGQGAAQLAQGALGAYQAYGGYNQYKEGNKVGGALNMAGGGANVAAAAGSSTAASATPYLSAALGGYNAYNAATGPGSDEQRANAMQKAAGLAVADFYTFGGASLANKAFGKEIGEVEKAAAPVTENKYFQIAFNPYMYAAVKAADYVGLGHESTRDTAKRHTKQLLKQSDDPGYQAYVSAMREQFNSAPTGKAFGKYDTWEEAERAGLEADKLTGVMGNIESFGPNWTKLNFDQQKAVTQALIDAKQYHSKKGEVLVHDQNKAREIYDTVAKGGFKIPVVSKTPTNDATSEFSGFGKEDVDPIYTKDPGKVTSWGATTTTKTPVYGKSTALVTNAATPTTIKTVDRLKIPTAAYANAFKGSKLFRGR